MKKHIEIIILVLMVVLVDTTSYAMMGTGMAGYDDETADKKLQEEQQEWKQEQEERIAKSSNNYLKSLSINNHKITPEFDKQTINYEIKDEIKEDTITINAELDNEKAIISGNGEVKLNQGENNLEITVTAENGMVRTYYIKATKSDQTSTTNNIAENAENEKSSNTNITAQELEKNEITEIKENHNTLEKYKKKIIITSIAIVIIAVISIIIIKSKNRHNSKH